MRTLGVFLAATALSLAGCDTPSQKTFLPRDSFLVADSMWGKSESEIKRIETLWSFSEKYGEISYSGFVKFAPTDSLRTLLTYYFQSGKLNKVQHYLKFSSKNDSAYVSVVSKVYSVLIGSLGKPISSNTRWPNELYRNQPTMLGRAIKLGHVTYDATWESKFTRLQYDVLSDLDGELTLSLRFSSKEYSNQFTPSQ